MNVLDDVLYKEIMEKEAELAALKDKLDSLPKGSVYISRNRSGSYAYRKWREEDKVLSEYLGNMDSNKTLEKINQVNEYKVVKEQIKREKQVLDELKKAYRLILLKTRLN